MMRTLVIIFSLLGIVKPASSQYYFQDIFNTQRAIANMAALKSQKVSTQSVQTFDPENEPDKDFRCIRITNPTYHQLRSITNSSSTGYEVLVSSFSYKGLLTKTIDSTNSSITITQYRYDEGGRLVSVSSSSTAISNKMKFEEVRRYQYDSAGKLLSMVRKKAAANDSLLVKFKTDSAGNVIEEQPVMGKRTFYNYDKLGQLTDVYSYNSQKRRMLPDYIFEYSGDKMMKMTVVNGATSEYSIWEYTYNQQGLPDRETCYGKGKELMGMVKYNYTFNP
jgi:YD repeat-containing protein